jgi:hypothetical protein
MSSFSNLSAWVKFVVKMLLKLSLVFDWGINSLSMKFGTSKVTHANKPSSFIIFVNPSTFYKGASGAGFVPIVGQYNDLLLNWSSI